MRLIDADALEKYMKRDEWGTPDERWRPESEFGAKEQTVRLWACGEFTPSNKFIPALAKALGIAPDVLIFDVLGIKRKDV